MTALAYDPEDLPSTGPVPTPIHGASAAPLVLPGHSGVDALVTLAGEAQTPPPTSDPSQPIVAASAEAQHGRDHTSADAQRRGVAADNQRVVRGHVTHATQGILALDDPLLYLAAASLDDLERVRIAAENRLRQLTRDEEDVDGEERGFSLTPDNPQVRAQQSVVDGLAALEHGAELTLKRRLRTHPLHGWIKSTVGIGEKQAARLLAAVGDPYWNTLHNRPRTVSELWAYAGYKVIPAGQGPADTQAPGASGEQSDGSSGHTGPATQTGLAGTAVRRKKGQRANWSTVAKMRAFLIAKSCIKQARSPYRPLYEQRRAHTAITHPEWTPGHSDNDALRIVAKEVLKDLWIAARDVHEQSGGQRVRGTHQQPAAGPRHTEPPHD